MSSGEHENLALSMLLVFGGAKIAGEIFERLRMPAIVGEIVAGMILGPAVLGWVQWNSTLHALAELGVMFLLFRVGLEVKSSELISVGGRALWVAILGVVLPFAAGYGIAAWWGEATLTSTFVAAAMVATSVGITAQVLAAKGLLQTTSARIILAAAVVDDILGLLVLAVVSSFAKGDVNVAGLVTTTLLAVGFTLFFTFWGTAAMQRILPKVSASLRTGEVQFNFALVFLFVLAVGAAYAGVAAIVGAFLAGMALSESINHRVHDLVHGVTELLVPFFLAGIGVQMDISIFRDSSALTLAIIISVAAVLSKMVGCGLAARTLGKRAAMQVGIGMVPRGEVGMVVAQIGMTMGVVPAHIYGVVVFMAIITTVIAPPLLAIAFKGEAGGPAEERFQLG
ncbi:sodium:proton antiporter [Bryobacterales bacterium F-183]|nr:sodium:proton antiporter [Bryobacterales bacterium F-183]